MKLYDSDKNLIANSSLILYFNLEKNELKESMITDYEGLMRLKFKIYYADQDLISCNILSEYFPINFRKRILHENLS